jgi:hypothetical protein
MIKELTTKDKVIGAFFDGHEWAMIDGNYLKVESLDYDGLSNARHISLINAIQHQSKRSALLHGIFINADCIGNVILDKPQIMFLHGVRYDRKED